MKLKALVAGIAVTLCGCGSMSGLDANTDFVCKAPSGILCDSMSGIYANAMARNLPSQRTGQRNNEGEQDLSHAKPYGVIPQAINSGMPIRSAPRVLRVWFAPWEDTDGDLHDQSYVYLPVDLGKWLIEHNRQQLINQYRPVKPPSGSTAPLQPIAAKNTNTASPQRSPKDTYPLTISDEKIRDLMGQIKQPQEVVPSTGQ